MNYYFSAIRDPQNLTFSKIVEIKECVLEIDIEEKEVFEYMIKNEIIQANRYDFMKTTSDSVNLMKTFSNGATFGEYLLKNPVDRMFSMSMYELTKITYKFAANLDNRDLAFLNIICAENARFSHQFDNSLKYAEKALKLIKKHFSKGDYYTWYHRVGIIYYTMNNIKKSAKIIKECHDWNIKNRPHHGETLNSMIDHVSNVDEFISHEEAIPLYKECLKLHLEKHGEAHPNTLLLRKNYAACMIDLKIPGGIAELEEIYKLQKSVYGWNIKTIDTLEFLLLCNKKLEYMDDYVEMYKLFKYGKLDFSKKHVELTEKVKGIEAAKDLALWYVKEY